MNTTNSDFYIDITAIDSAIETYVDVIEQLIDLRVKFILIGEAEESVGWQGNGRDSFDIAKKQFAENLSELDDVLVNTVKAIAYLSNKSEDLYKLSEKLSNMFYSNKMTNMKNQESKF